MSKIYTLRIETSNVSKITLLLGKTSSDESNYYWEYSIEENLNDDVDELEILLNFYESKKRILLDSQLSESATLWYFYEYDQQCNMEFGAEVINRMSILELGLCISCWEL